MEGEIQTSSSQDYSSLSVKDLRGILEGKGVSHSDCFEKSELVRKVIESENLSSVSLRKDVRVSQGIKRWKEKISTMDCIVIQPESVADSDIKMIVIICHGYGANNEDFVPIGELLLKQSNLKIRFVFPNGIQSLDGNARAWWPLDMNDLFMKIMSGNLNSVFGTPPPGLAESRAAMLSLIAKMKEDTQLPTSKIAIGGFSQGSMLATDVALHLDENPAALIVFSGLYLCTDLWKSLITKRKGLKVLQSHGAQDGVLPYALATKLKDLFEENHLDIEFVSFAGGHVVGEEVLARFLALLMKIAS